MVIRFSPFRFPSCSFADWAQFELDTLEDIFKRSDWQERALKPALSSILAPALCAVYASYEDKSISNLEDDHVIWDRYYTIKDLSSIEVKVQRADSPTSPRNNFFLPIGDDRERPRSPELLYPPIANIAETKEKLLPPYDSGRSSPIFVSGYEAERQQNDIKQFGREVASKLAERRAEYAKRRLSQLQEENEIIERNIEEAVKSKMKQLQMAGQLEKDGTFLKERRAKLWRRCVNMAEIFAKEEAEAVLWQKRYEETVAEEMWEGQDNCSYPRSGDEENKALSRSTAEDSREKPQLKIDHCDLYKVFNRHNICLRRPW